MGLSEVADVLLAPFTTFIDPSERLSIYYQLTALMVAVGFYIRSRAGSGGLRPVGLLRWLFPKEIITHPSAMMDYGFFVSNNILGAAIYGTILISAPIWSDFFQGVFAFLFGPPGPGFAPSHWITLLCSVFLLMVVDATIWWAHYMFHVVPVLWEFHKVHHSAEVMTPITAFRIHPVEEVFDSLVTGFTGGFALAALNYTLGPAAQMFLLFETNIFLIAFALAAFNLRHSHVSFRYPAWLQHILISPAQHQIHHSQARDHWDRNMGLVFSIWDWAAGTLCLANKGDDLTYGLGTAEDGTWRGVGMLYLRPFRQAWRVLNARPRGRPGRPAEDVRENA